MSTTYDGGRQLGRLTIHDDAQQMIDRAREEGIETVWDRLRAQEPQCGYCQLGLSCRNCAMGPCRIDPFGEGPQKGVCGADADVIVARNLGRAIAAGSSSHSDHGRDILEVFSAMAHGETSGYQVTDEAKLRRIAEEIGIATEGRSVNEVAIDLADELMANYGTRDRSPSSNAFPRCDVRSGRVSTSRRAVSTARTSR
jgi:carbon-monoxide dehydrogenase catalytic subunit